MGIYVLTLVKKLIVKSVGVKTCLAVAVNLALLLLVSNSPFIAFLTLALISVASLASVFIDFKLHASTIYVLYMCGSKPKDIRLLLLLISFINSTLLSIPYVIFLDAYSPIAFLIALTAFFTSLNYIYIRIRSSASIPQI